MLGRRAREHERERAAAPENCARSGVSVPEPQARVRRDRLVEPLRRGDVGDADPQVVDVAAGAQRLVVDGLDAVAVGIEQNAAVVVGAVLRPRPGRPVVAVSGAVPARQNSSTSSRDGATNADVQAARHRVLRVGGTSEKSSHSANVSSALVRSMPSGANTVA